MTRRKTLLVAMSIAVVAILAVGGSLAYFTATQAKSNVFTVGNVRITLTEPDWESSGKKDGATVYPGEPLAKDPTVTNVGANPCFVRIKVEGLASLVPVGTPDADKGKYMITLRGVNAEWELYEGYYYYKRVLGTSEQPELLTKTPKLFTHIEMPTAIENGNGWSPYTVNVTAQAVQAQGALPSFGAVKTMTVAEIAGWFTTCGMVP